MRLEKIHQSGPALSRIVAGAWRWNKLSTNELDTIIRSAVELGITTFDHADIYGDYSNEEIFGNAIKGQTALVQKIQIVTKCGIKLMSGKKPDHRIKHYDTSKAHITQSVDNSLKLLGVEKIDLLLIHRPDPLMNTDEVAESFAQLKNQGKVLHFGVSNFTPSQFDLLQSVFPFPLVTNQIELSLSHHTPMYDGTIDHLYKHKVSPMAWSPFGGGKLFDSSSEVGGRVSTQGAGLLEKYRINLSQLLLAWLLKHPSNIFPVVGTGNPQRLKEASRSVDVALDQQDWFDMLKWARGTDVP